MTRLDEYDISNPMAATVLETKRLTPQDSDEVRHIVLDVSNGDFHFVEGQSIGVLMPEPDEFGNPHRFRLYSIASSREGDDNNPQTISLCIKRCFGVDVRSGERVKGAVSNYLCDLQPGDTIKITGPYGVAFAVPDDNTSNLLMIALGTGIAPFRAFVKHIYESANGWKGKVRLFYGCKRGIDLLYMNREKDDLSQYYDQGTFKAFEAVSPCPAIDQPIALEKTLAENADDVWGLIQDPKTYVFIAGLSTVLPMLDRAMSCMAGSESEWNQKKTELKQSGRWFELLS